VETRHPVGGPFGHEFSAFVIIAVLWRPESQDLVGNFVNNFCVFFGKTTHQTQTVATARISPKVCQGQAGQPPYLVYIVPDLIQIGSRKRVKTVLPRRVFTILTLGAYNYDISCMHTLTATVLNNNLQYNTILPAPLAELIVWMYSMYRLSFFLLHMYVCMYTL